MTQYKKVSNAFGKHYLNFNTGGLAKLADKKGIDMYSLMVKEVDAETDVIKKINKMFEISDYIIKI